jgi:hypothetical protein
MAIGIIAITGMTAVVVVTGVEIVVAAAAVIAGAAAAAARIADRVAEIADRAGLVEIAGRVEALEAVVAAGKRAFERINVKR